MAATGGPDGAAGGDRMCAGNGGFDTETVGGTEVRTYPGRPRSLTELLDRGVVGGGGRLLLEAPEGRVSYREFAELVEGAAARLAEEGLRPGDRLAVCLRNGLDIAVAIWACARADLVFLGLPTTLAPPRWAYLLEHSGAALVLTGEEFRAGIEEAGALAGLPADRVRPVGDHLTGRRLPWTGGQPWPEEDSTYGVIYTSGTTGAPKASRLTHRATVHAAEYYVRTLGLTERDMTAIHLPFYYLSGHITQLAPVMLAGGSAIAIARFTPRSLVRLLAERPVTFLDLVPSLFALLLRVPEFSYPQLAHVRTAVFGGAPMPAATIAALRERLPQLRLYDVYGMTETSAPICVLLDSEFARRPGSVGRPIPVADVRVVDEHGLALGRGEAGELEVRGPMVTPGYFGDAEASLAAVRAGWLRTGDLARIDGEGYVYLLDRVKDMIIHAGVKVFSVEVEYALVRHPAILEAAVVGVPDPVAFENVAAFVVVAPGQTVTTEDVQRWVAGQIAAHAAPRLVRVVEQLPRNQTGKVDKLALRQQLAAGP